MENEIWIGYEAEQNSRNILIDLKDRDRWPDAFVSLIVTRPGETTPYLAAGVETHGRALIWTPNGYDMQKPGTGAAVVLYTKDQSGTVILGKSPVYKVIVGKTIPGTDQAEIPDPYQAWVATITGIAAEAYQHEQGALAAQEAAETAQGKAEDAQTAAETAQGKAEDAQTAAETARGKAEDAQTAAENAQGKAETAQGKAEDAQTAAETAQGKAEDAQTAAETAQGKAETAQGKAEDAQTAAETAQGKAEDAQTAAETAQGKAEDAQTAAETAQGKAEDAQTAAETAQEKAEDAQEAAETAAGSIQTAQAQATTLEPNQPATAEIQQITGGLKFVFGIPKGESGNDDIDDTAGAGVTDKVWSANRAVRVESSLKKIGIAVGDDGTFYIDPVNE